MARYSPENFNALYAASRSRSLNGTTRYLSLGVAVATAPPISMFCRFRPASGAGQYGLVSVDDGVTDSFTPGYYMQTGAVGAGTLDASSCDGSSGSHAETTNTFAANTWNSASAVFDSNSLRRCSLNGGAEAFDTTTINPTGIATTKIGKLGATSQFFSGLIGTVFIWRIALTTAECQRLHAGEAPWRVRGDYLIAGPRMSDLFDPVAGLEWVNNAGALLVGQPNRIRTPRLHRPYISVPAPTPASGNSAAMLLRRRRMAVAA